MNAQELGRLAGFLEGEGSFVCRLLEAPDDGPRRTGRFTLAVSAVSTDKDVIDYCQAIAGGRVTGPYGGRGRRKPYWRWRAGRQADAIKLITQLQPLMGKRRSAQIQACIDAYASRGVIAPADRTHCPQGHAYTSENMTVRPNGWRQCRTCNTERLRTKRTAANASALEPVIIGGEAYIRVICE